MSRVGKAIINVPDGVNITIKGSDVTVKGKLGELSETLSDSLEVTLDGSVLTVSRKNEEKQTKADHGLYRALLNNMVLGVSTGWTKKLELIGVGYRVQGQGQKLDLALGYSHNILFEVPSEVKVEAIAEKGKNPTIILTSHDKQLIGMVAAKIRSLRKPEPYKGKGVRFVGEYIRRKAGKTAGK